MALNHQWLSAISFIESLFVGTEDGIDCGAAD
jgi:hypothetical protein